MAAPLPNIVLIFTDDQGYADVGCFGAEGFETPHLDRMAEEGTRFTNFHVPQPVCSASRAALMTGCYPTRVGIEGALNPRSRFGLSSGERTLAELLKDRGYTTGMVGKWHLGHHPEFLPTRHGFDEWFGLPYSNDMWPLGKRSDSPPLPMFENDEVVIAGVTADDQAQLTTWYTERAVKFIEKNKEHPFFLYVAHTMPHVPLFVSDKFKGKSKRGLYGDVIMEIDWSVGQILDALKRNGLDERTWVIFTSDNGPWLLYGEHGGSAKPLREGKATNWEGGTRVPCIMRWPGQIPAATTSDAMLMTIDLMPTVAQLVDAKLPDHPIDGRDVWPIISGQKDAKNPHSSYWYYWQPSELRAVVTGDGRWKLQFPHTYPSVVGGTPGQNGIRGRMTRGEILKPELYDLLNDPGEAANVVEKHPDIVQLLEAEAEKARAELGDTLSERAGTGLREAGRLAAGHDSSTEAASFGRADLHPE